MSRKLALDIEKLGANYMPRMNMPAGPGRPRGSKNKLPLEARAYIMSVAAQLQAEGRGMLEWARENPDPFWTKCFKAVLPKEITATVFTHEMALAELDEGDL